MLLWFLSSLLNGKESKQCTTKSLNNKLTCQGEFQRHVEEHLSSFKSTLKLNWKVTLCGQEPKQENKFL